MIAISRWLRWIWSGDPLTPDELTEMNHRIEALELRVEVIEENVRHHPDH